MTLPWRIILLPILHQQQPSLVQGNETNLGLTKIVNKCEWYKYDNPDNIPLNGEAHKKKWRICLYSGKILYQNSDVQHICLPLDQ